MSLFCLRVLLIHQSPFDRASRTLQEIPVGQLHQAFRVLQVYQGVPCFQTFLLVQLLRGLPLTPLVQSFLEVLAHQGLLPDLDFLGLPFLQAIHEHPWFLASPEYLEVLGTLAYPEVPEVHVLPSYQLIPVLQQALPVLDLQDFQPPQGVLEDQQCLVDPSRLLCHQGQLVQEGLDYLFPP